MCPLIIKEYFFIVEFNFKNNRTQKKTNFLCEFSIWIEQASDSISETSYVYSWLDIILTIEDIFRKLHSFKSKVTKTDWMEDRNVDKGVESWIVIREKLF